MKRLDNWEMRLADVIEASRKRPLAYGQHDCGLFVARCYEAITGVNVESRFIGTYRNRREAKILCESHGGLAELVAHFLGPAKAGSEARRGDVVAVNDKIYRVALGICDGPHGIFVGQRTMQAWPRSAFVATWGIG